MIFSCSARHPSGNLTKSHKHRSADDDFRRVLMRTDRPLSEHKEHKYCEVPPRNHPACVAQENGVGKFLVAALAFGNPSQPRSKCAVGAYYGCAAVLPVVSGRLRETTRHRVRRPRLTFTGRLSAACLPLLLAACATPAVTRSCLTQKQYEQLKAAEPPRIHDKLTGKADEDTRPLAGSALELRSWGHAMLDTLKICSTTP